MDISDWRERIDAIDVQLVELLNQRCRCAQAIGHLKRNQSMPVYEPNREKKVLGNVFQANQGPLSNAALQHIFERIIDEMRAIQKVELLAEAPGASSETAASQPQTGSKD